MSSEDQDPVDMHEAMIEDWWKTASEGARYRDFVKQAFRLHKLEQACQAAEESAVAAAQDFAELMEEAIGVRDRLEAAEARAAEIEKSADLFLSALGEETTAKEQAEARVAELEAELTACKANKTLAIDARNQAEAKLAEAEKDIASREARRIEILEWLEDKIGTAFDCPNCHWSGYHQNAYECEECGTPFPLEHHIAFKLHASHKGDWQSE